jgi:hypothetical protein
MEVLTAFLTAALAIKELAIRSAGDNGALAIMVVSEVACLSIVPTQLSAQ